MTPELWPSSTLRRRTEGNTSLQAWHSLGAQGRGYHMHFNISLPPSLHTLPTLPTLSCALQRADRRRRSGRRLSDAFSTLLLLLLPSEAKVFRRGQQPETRLLFGFLFVGAQLRVSDQHPPPLPTHTHPPTPHSASRLWLSFLHVPSSDPCLFPLFNPRGALGSHGSDSGFTKTGAQAERVEKKTQTEQSLLACRGEAGRKAVPLHDKHTEVRFGLVPGKLE